MIRLNPTEEQVQYFEDAAYVARFTWNWALGWYNEGVPFNYLKLEFNRLRREEGLLPVADSITTYANQQSFIDLKAAITRYFDFKKKGELKPPKDWKGRKDGQPFGWPRFKGRHNSTPSFYCVGSALKTGDHFLKLPNLKSEINMSEPLRFQGKINSARISYRGGYWWASFSVDMPYEPEPHASDKAVGIDLGIKYLALTCDTDGVYAELPNLKPYYKHEQKLARLQRKLDRQRRANNPDNYNEDGTVKTGCKWVKGSNERKTEKQLAKVSQRIANIRKEQTHEWTSQLANEYSLICLEDLNIKGMMKNRKLSKAIGDAALYEKRRQLEYKAKWNGGQVSIVDRWFPSSKACGECGEVNSELKLSDRVWICDNCGSTNERDRNAAKNILNEGIRLAAQ